MSVPTSHCPGLSAHDVDAIASAVAERVLPALLAEVRRGVPERLLRLEEVAEVLGVNVRTVRRIVARGELASVHPTLGRSRRVHPDALDAFMRARSVTSG